MKRKFEDIEKIRQEAIKYEKIRDALMEVLNTEQNTTLSWIDYRHIDALYHHAISHVLELEKELREFEDGM